MKPPPFRYFAPETVEEALELRAEHGDDSAVLAGGQSLVPLLSLRMAMPEVVIDLRRVGSLARIEATNGVVSFGAMVRQRTAERSPEVASGLPLMIKALRYVGHPPIRSRGTVGGSLAHADPAAELPAVALALDAQFEIGKAGSAARTVEAAGFFLGFLTTAVEPDELLLSVRFPKLPSNAGSAFVEVARRAGDFAIAGAGVVIVQRGRPDHGRPDRVHRRRRRTGARVGGRAAPRRELAVAGALRRGGCGGSCAARACRRHPRHVFLSEACRPGGRASRTRGGERMIEIELTVNGERRTARVEPRYTLADLLREGFGLTGTHLGCEHGICGACTVLVDGAPARSCLMLAPQADGASVRTIEGLVRTANSIASRQGCATRMRSSAGSARRASS